MSNKITMTLSNVDWELLRMQKEDLLAVAEGSEKLPANVRESLSGISHLLDHIQDQAANRLGDVTVFGA